MSLQAQIRELLRHKDYEDGLTPTQIANALGSKPSHVHGVLETMEKIDAYVDRWIPALCPGGYVAVWTVTPAPPPHAPRPDPRPPQKWPDVKRPPRNRAQSA